ncbi:MAG: J domain-containing protein [Thermaerobacter sp.]|nr:J domain-containing protein [Thermaerobacter sp.]
MLVSRCNKTHTSRRFDGDLPRSIDIAHAAKKLYWISTPSSVGALQKGGLPLAGQHRDPWEVLGIAPTADVNQIRAAYLAQARRHHPDQFRFDPERYRRQEEHMKAINEAYQWALRNPPTAPGTSPGAPPPESGPICPDHNHPGLRECRRCHQPICLGCQGFRQSLCNRHVQSASMRQTRGRALKEWAPLIVLIVVMRSFDQPGIYIGVAVLIYVAWLGLRLLLARRWFGCLAFLLLPYSLVLAGVWSLIESLKEWNRSPGRTRRPSS